jgi:hypothetical protein
MHHVNRELTTKFTAVKEKFAAQGVKYEDL